MSDDDLEALAVPGANALERARYLQQQTQAQWLALTLGPEGAWLLQRDGLAVHAREEAPITVVDTVGAGDCFLAGLITAWLAGPERGEEARARGAEGLTAPVTEARLRAMLLHALASAGHCVERAGCTPPALRGSARKAGVAALSDRSGPISLTQPAWLPVYGLGCEDGQRVPWRVWRLLPRRRRPRERQ